jgi:hypothetical protein
MLKDVLHLEERLETWTRNLPPDMNVTQASPATPDGPYKLGIILRLRYLNTRSLIHRVVVSSMLRTVGSAESQAPSSPSLDLARKASLETCVSSSLEVISRIHYATSEDSPRVKALGAWWFSLYYSEQKPQTYPFPNERRGLPDFPEKPLMQLSDYSLPV